MCESAELGFVVIQESGEDDSSVISQLVADFTHASEPNSTVALEEEDTAKCVAAVAVEGKSQLCTGGLNIDSVIRRRRCSWCGYGKYRSNMVYTTRQMLRPLLDVLYRRRFLLRDVPSS